MTVLNSGLSGPNLSLDPRAGSKFVRPTVKLALLAFALGLSASNVHAQTLWTGDYRDAAGWNQPQYGTTIMLGDVNGDGRDDVCGRGVAGIYCSMSAGDSFGVPVLASNAFSDINGWNNLIYYGSIRLADVNGDGRADVCGRGAAGVYCAISNGAGFGNANLWTIYFKNADGWNQPQYGTTIMFGDINGDGREDLCGRGVAGIYCSLSTGFAFLPPVLATSSYSDASGWNNIVYYGTIRLADVNGDRRADVCGRGAAGIYCAMSTGGVAFGALQFWTHQYRNIDGWDQPQYGTTIMLADVNGDRKADVCGRGVAGIYCSLSRGTSFGPAELAIQGYSDAHGWAHLVYYGSIRLGDLNRDGRADVCGRGGAGMYCALSTVSFQ